MNLVSLWLVIFADFVIVELSPVPVGEEVALAEIENDRLTLLVALAVTGALCV